MGMEILSVYVVPSDQFRQRGRSRILCMKWGYCCYVPLGSYDSRRRNSIIDYTQEVWLGKVTSLHCGHHWCALGCGAHPGCDC